MPRKPLLPRSWWDVVLDGKLRHIPAVMNTRYGSTASLRAAIYREAVERGLGVVTVIDRGTGDLYLQTWNWRTESRPYLGWPGEGHPVLAPDPRHHEVRPVDKVMLQLQITAAGLDPEDPERVEERLYCTCGLGNATEGKVHDPGCGAWG